jgi:N-acyl-D-amino-acid deacylase
MHLLGWIALKQRRWGFAGALLLAVGAVGACRAAAPETETYDLLIRNGRIVDGTGNPWFRGDVAIRGDRIAAIGPLLKAHGHREIDAQGRVVSPGFVDMHSHASWSYLIDSRAASKVTQGITLEIEGEGESVAPLTDRMVERRQKNYRRFAIKPDWRTLDDFFRRLEAHPATINFATYIGTGTVREYVIGLEDARASPKQLNAMRGLVAQAMQDGALGVYSALIYVPDTFNSTAELIEMAKVAERYGGVYQTHPRSEGDAANESLDELFEIAAKANIPGHLTHIKACYQQNWGTLPHTLDRIEQARGAGLDITGDMYPYDRGDGTFTVLVPPWVQAGGTDAMRRRLKDKKLRERIKREMVTPAKDWENEYYGVGGGPDGITLVDARGNKTLTPYVGKSLREIAASMKADPRDAVFDIILAGDAGLTDVLSSEDDIRAALQRPWISFGTDGFTVAPDGPLSEELVHPRAYGTYGKIFGTYVRELKLIRLEEAVRRATSQATQRLNIRGRGLLREGYYADIVVFDPDSIQDLATYERPHQYTAGIPFVIVNGEVVVDEGRITGARPGRVVRGPGWQKRPN